jgi:hypothetical protein
MLRETNVQELKEAHFEKRTGEKAPSFKRVGAG